MCALVQPAPCRGWDFVLSAFKMARSVFDIVRDELFWAVSDAHRLYHVLTCLYSGSQFCVSCWRQRSSHLEPGSDAAQGGGHG